MLLRAILIWSVLLLVEGIIVILVVPPTLVINAAYKEEVAMIETLGPEISQIIIEKSNDTFQSWFVDSGVMAETFHLFIPTEAEKRKSTGL